MTSFLDKVTQRLVDVGLSMPELAAQLGLSEPALQALCHAGNPRLSELQQLGAALRIDPSYFLDRPTGPFSIRGVGNVQKIKITKAAAHELAGNLVSCQRALDLADALVASKNETISLLRERLAQLN